MSSANRATASIASGDPLDVRSFAVTQAMNGLFRIEVTAVSSNLDIDFDEVLAEEASFALGTTFAIGAAGAGRTWNGVAAEMHQVRVDKDGLATYELVVVPRLWLLTQRTNYRVFQFKTELDIVKQLLSEWGIDHRAKCGRAYKTRKIRTQYGESDFAFMSRMLEEAGINYWFEDEDGKTTLVLDDAPESGEASHPGLSFFDKPGVSSKSFATKVVPAGRTRPGKTTIQDLDYRKPSTGQPRASAAFGLEAEGQLEQFDYEPGAFLYAAAGDGSTPTADDRGASRTDEGEGRRKAEDRLLGRRQRGREIAFQSDVIALAPGSVVSISDHPHPTVGGSPLLVTEATIRAKHSDDWRVDVVAVGTDTPFRPIPVTPKPIVPGLESATVVGGSGDDIHTDEYARVRVHFHWDREDKRDQASSCWIPTNQPWAGASFGGTVIPRVGQEVLVEFLGGDPDRPVVLGRTYTEYQPPPYQLPRGKTLTALIGNPTPGMVMGGAGGAVDMDVLQFQRGGNWGDALQTQAAMNSQYLADDKNIDFKRNSNAANPEFMADYPSSMRTKAGYGDTRNMLVLGDQKDDNLVFLQAQRDLNMLVKHGWRTVVGNYRGTMIIGHDDLRVTNKQLISVTDAQLLKVRKNQSIEVTKKRYEQIGEELGLVVKDATKIAGKKTISLKAKKSVVFESNEAIQLKVGSSLIRIDKKAIVLSSPKVDINPYGGALPQPRLKPITEQMKQALEAAGKKANAERPSMETSAARADDAAENPNLVDAGTSGLQNQFAHGENAATINGNNYGMYRDQLVNGAYTGGRPMTPEQADATLAKFSGL